MMLITAVQVLFLAFYIKNHHLHHSQNLTDSSFPKLHESSSTVYA